MEELKVSMDSLAASVHSRMAAFEQELKKDPSKVDSIQSISADFLCFRDFVLASLGALQKQLEILTGELDGLEMRSRRKMLLLHGMSEVKDEDTVARVVEVAHKYLSLGELQPEDIRRAHRLGRSSTTSDKPRPVLVKFSNIKTRDAYWMSKVGLKGTGITASEFLTHRRHKIFVAARQKLGVTKCWTREGRIVYQGPDGKRHTIVSTQDIERFVEGSRKQESQPSGAGSNLQKTPGTPAELSAASISTNVAQGSNSKSSNANQVAGVAPKRTRGTASACIKILACVVY